MEVDKILAQLREELQALDDSIVALEKVAAAQGGKKRGRPPAWLTEARKRKEAEFGDKPTARKPSKKTASRRAKKKASVPSE